MLTPAASDVKRRASAQRAGVCALTDGGSPLSLSALAVAPSASGLRRPGRSTEDLGGRGSCAESKLSKPDPNNVRAVMGIDLQGFGRGGETEVNPGNDVPETGKSAIGN